MTFMEKMMPAEVHRLGVRKLAVTKIMQAKQSETGTVNIYGEEILIAYR